MSTSYMPRRRNTITLKLHRSPRGVFTKSKVSGKTVRPGGYLSDKYQKFGRSTEMAGVWAARSRRIKKSSKKRAAAKKKTSRKVARRPAKARRRANPGRSRRTSARRRRRATGIVVLRAPRRRRRRSRSTSLARAPRRRRRVSAHRRSRRRARRGVVLHRRRRGGVARRRNPGGRIVSAFRNLFSWSTLIEVGGGLGGLAIGFAGPKYIAQLTGISGFQRGLGGVATSVVSTTVASGLVSMFSPRSGSALLIGGLMGSGLLLLSAFLPDTRAQFFPIEEALLAAALPTMGGATPAQKQMSGAAQGMLNNLIAAGQSPETAMAMVKSMGLGDYLRPGQLNDYYVTPQRQLAPARSGVADYYGAGSKAASYFKKSEDF